MDGSYVYEIRIEGHLSDRWSAWFDEMVVDHPTPGETTLRGLLVDQAALFGLLAKIHTLNLTLIAVNRVPAHRS
jgi:hypothetical protein